MESEMKFQLSEEMIEDFYKEGYFYAPDFIQQELVDALNEENEAFSNLSGTGEWRSHPFTHFDTSATQYPVTAHLLTSPDLIEAFERILGGPIRLWLGMYAVVSPHGDGLQWHQDNQYTHILGHMLNGFIALDHISQENAGLWLAPQSHRFGRLPNLNASEAGHRRAPEPDNGIPCRDMKPGDAVIFHRETLHHSKKNHTNRPRRAYAFQVASATCRYAKTGKLLEDRDLLSGMKGRY